MPAHNCFKLQKSWIFVSANAFFLYFLFYRNKEKISITLADNDNTAQSFNDVIIQNVKRIQHFFTFLSSGKRICKYLICIAFCNKVYAQATKRLIFFFTILFKCLLYISSRFPTNKVQTNRVEAKKSVKISRSMQMKSVQTLCPTFSSTFFSTWKNFARGVYKFKETFGSRLLSSRHFPRRVFRRVTNKHGRRREVTRERKVGRSPRNTGLLYSQHER